MMAVAVDMQLLKPGGDGIPVSTENRLQYVHLAADWHLHSRLGAPARAFSEGIAQVVTLLCCRFEMKLRYETF